MPQLKSCGVLKTLIDAELHYTAHTRPARSAWYRHGLCRSTSAHIWLFSCHCVGN